MVMALRKQDDGGNCNMKCKVLLNSPDMFDTVAKLWL